MAATPATIWGVNMTLLTGNTGGAIENLPNNQVGSKERVFVEKLALATQTTGSIIGVARIPLFAVMLGITVLTDTSLGSSTIKFGNAGNGNSAIYGAAATVTSTLAANFFAAIGTYGQQITTGFDSVSGNAVTFTGPGSGGGLYEEIIMTTAVANLPASGTMFIVTRYAID